MSGGLNGLEMHPKLIEDLIIPNMESTEKKHHQEDGLYYHLTMGQFKSKAVKAGAILNDGLGVALDIVEERERREVNALETVSG